MKKTKSQSGITLVALIITILVLLILAGVAIKSIQDGGILTKAQQAADKYTQAQNDELASLDELTGEIALMNPKIGAVAGLDKGDFIKYGNDLCLVLYNDNTEGLQIISTQILGEQTLSGVDGFENRVKYFKDACSSYINKRYGAIDARVPGYTFNEINNIEIKNTYKLELDDGTIKTINSYGRPDSSITTEVDNLSTVLTNVLTNGISTVNGDVWLSNYSSNRNLEYYIHYYTITSTGATNNKDTLASYSEGTKKLSEFSATRGILPIVLLDQRIEVTSGSGTYADPYVYKF